MNDERRHELEESGKGLTEEEMALGWHWCASWDDMLVGPEDLEAYYCTCNKTTMAWVEWQKALNKSGKPNEDLGLECE